MGVGNLGIGVSVGGGLGRLPFCSFIQPSVSPLLPGFPGFPYSSTFHLLDTGSLVHFDSLGNILYVHTVFAWPAGVNGPGE
jgi:hypothetical protein